MEKYEYMEDLRDFILDKVDVDHLKVEFNEVDFNLEKNDLNNLVVIHEGTKLDGYMQGSDDLLFLCYIHHQDRLELQKIKSKIFNSIDLQYNGSVRYICDDMSEPFLGTLGKTKYKAIRFSIKILI